MALGQYSTDYFRSVYHRVFSVKYSDFCILVILVSLEASFTPVIIKKNRHFLNGRIAKNKYLFEIKKNSLTHLLFGMTVYTFIRSRGRKLSYPADITRNVLVLKEISIPPELALLCQTVHIRPLGDGDICTCLVRMLHFISQYIPASEPKVTFTFLTVLFP